ncbi:MAG: glycosyltransferase, partial [Deltaproteobacteria bacterium]|nr:glycosyltransferase [Deltaproteobacteria bacterium]
SVCIATYNGEKYLSQQINSILGQLGLNDEIVVSDDSSTDSTVATLKSFNDPRVNILGNNQFRDPIYNFENAMKHASGHVIILADQDDIWLPDKLDLVRTCFAKRDMSAIHTMVMDGCIVGDDEELIDTSIFKNLSSGKGLIKNLFANTYMGCCMAFTRPLLDIALPFPRGIPMHDSWLGLVSELFGTVEFVPEKTIKYRKHAQNHSFREFTCVQQVRWRCSLVYHLLRRGLEVKKRFNGRKIEGGPHRGT